MSGSGASRRPSWMRTQLPESCRRSVSRLCRCNEPDAQSVLLRSRQPDRSEVQTGMPGVSRRRLVFSSSWIKNSHCSLKGQIAQQYDLSGNFSISSNCHCWQRNQYELHFRLCLHLSSRCTTLSSLITFSMHELKAKCATFELFLTYVCAMQIIVLCLL